MGVAPDLSAEVDGGEDGGGVHPDVVEDVGPEWSDEGEGVVVKVDNAGDIAEEVFIDKFFLGDPKFLAAVVDNGVLMRVAVDGEGTGGSGEEVGKDVG